MTPRIARLRERALGVPRYLSVEQARLITEAYARHADQPRPIQRAHAFAHACARISIAIDPDELIVGNRTPDSRAGVVFPEAAVAWIDREIGDLPTRPQDPFNVREDDARAFREEVFPAWHGRTLEDRIYAARGDEIRAIEQVVKINQRDHAQGHIIPNVRTWLAFGPAGLREQAEARLAEADGGARVFYQSTAIALDGACRFIARYAELADAMADAKDGDAPGNLLAIATACRHLAAEPPATFREAVQAVWFLFALLHLESNASSFSPGRFDQYLLPYLEADLASGRLDLAAALEIVEAFWLKCNQIVYLRNAHSARYFAGFPIGFNVCIGGQTADGRDATNILSYLCLKAQEHLGLPQPNLSARLHEGSPDAFLEACTRVIGRGSGMPQVFNDTSIVPALERQGIAHADAMDYAVVGCVELSTQGNSLGWSDAAMFNLVKALELTLNHGRCLLTGAQLGLDLGGLDTYQSFAQVEEALAEQVRHFVARMMDVCRVVDRIHAEVLPTPFLSSVIDDCLARGIDVTAGGATYNLSGIQAIQVANLADCLAAIKHLVFDEGCLAGADLLEALRRDFADDEPLRRMLLSRAPKYGNGVAWVDDLGAQWAERFALAIEPYVNARGGRCHMGLYTVSAHVPMGKNVGATPDGRLAGAPLADGGLSAVYGRDERGPTALLQSVARIPSIYASNGSLLNMKFLPAFFATPEGRTKFVALLHTLVHLRIHHAQFNVVRAEDLIAAREHPELHRHLTIRVAGYTAYFTELANELQQEIIARTSYGEAP